MMNAMIPIAALSLDWCGWFPEDGVVKRLRREADGDRLRYAGLNTGSRVDCSKVEAPQHAKAEPANPVLPRGIREGRHAGSAKEIFELDVNVPPATRGAASAVGVRRAEAACRSPRIETTFIIGSGHRVSM
jgi:hypothetical protein